MWPTKFDTVSVCICGHCTAPVLQEVEPVGRWFEAYLSRSKREITYSNSEQTGEGISDEDDKKDACSSSSSDSEDERYLLTLDPKDWKVT